MTRIFKPGDFVGRKDPIYAEAYTVKTDTFEVASIDLHGNVTDTNGQVHFQENLESRLPPVPESPERKLPGSAQARSVRFAIGYLTALTYTAEIDGKPYNIRPEGLLDQDREVLNSVLVHLERLDALEKGADK